MNNGKTIDKCKCDLHQLERNRYFYGKLMTVRDFEAEQCYNREHRHLHNQALHGQGAICGFAVEPKAGAGNQAKLVVKPGMALDCCGRELILANDQEVDLKVFQEKIGAITAEKNLFLCIKYDECGREPVPALENASTCEEVCEHNRISEKVAFDVLTALPATAASQTCETWMNLTTVRARIMESGQAIAEFERTTAKWAKQGEVIEVRRKIKPLVSGKNITVTDVLPAGMTKLDGLLGMVLTGSIEGKAMVGSYLAKADTAATPKVIATQMAAPLQFPPAVLTASSIEIIAKSPDEQIQRQLFEEEFKTCPHCAGDPGHHCLILARVTLVPEGSSFRIKASDGVDDVTLAAGVYRQLVYPMPLVAELLECLKEKFLDQRSEEGIRSIEGVESPGGNVDLVPANAITIAADDVNNRITIGESHSARTDNPHNTTATQVGALVSVDGVSNPGGNVDLVAGTNITIVPDTAAKTITIATVGAATTVKSVASTPSVGVLSNFAREDHVHDIANSAVNGLKIADGTFVSSNASVSIIRQGNAFDFTAKAARIFTGEISLTLDDAGNVLQQLTVNELADGEPFAVILAPQLPASTSPIFQKPFNTNANGVHFIFGSTPNFSRIFVAFVPLTNGKYTRTFEIHGFAPEFKNQKIVFIFWVIAGAQIVSPVIPRRGLIADFLRGNPGATAAKVADELALDRGVAETELNRLVDEKIIRRDSRGKHTLK